MQIVYSRCCGIDVHIQAHSSMRICFHKDSVTVCVVVYSDLPEH